MESSRSFYSAGPMSRGQRFTFLGIAAVIAIVAVVLLAGGGDDSDEASTTSATATATATAAGDGDATATATPTATPKPKPPLLKAGREKALNAQQGDTVTFRVVNDEAEEVHIHGYDIKKELEPGKTETVSFKADIPGIFEIELEGSGTLLAQLKVVP
jgi:FtsP/CotA-like multicopper oxidase with cupredoxin domain